MKSRNLSESSLDPKVGAILEAAEERPEPDQRIELESVRSLGEALEESDGNPVISEIKPTSPTTEGVRNEDPAELARKMEEAGASAISVLTEEKHFGGSPENLKEAREAVDIPVLRKDFMLREEELDRVEADMVLLIARFLENLDQMIEAARERGFQPLVEVHTREELNRAVEAGAEIVGINNRDLAELEVDLETFERVSDEAPEDIHLIAESGIKTEEDVRRMVESGADAMLIGTAVMDGDVKQNIEKFSNSGES